MTGSPPITGGITVLAGLAAWIVVSRMVAGGDWSVALTTAVLILGIGAAFLVARGLAVWVSWLPPLAVLAGAGTLALVGADGLLDSPRSTPFGYSNATAAFYVQAAAAGVLLTTVASRRTVRAAGLGAAMMAALVPLVNGSVAGAALAGMILLGLAVMIRPEWGHGAVIAAGVGFCIALIATLVVGGQDAAAGSGSRRVVLWHEAIVILVEHPVIGAGAGEFAQASPTARTDPDARWAHQEFLELGAEAGLPALALALTAMMWGFRILMWAPPPQAAVGALALAAFAVHGCIDYVAHFPAVPLAMAMVVGAASAPPAPSLRREREPVAGR